MICYFDFILGYHTPRYWAEDPDAFQNVRYVALPLNFSIYVP